ncbi:MAG: chorismate-binding protein [Pseudomonadota bacterium]
MLDFGRFPFVFLEDPDTGGARLFQSPTEIISVDHIDDVENALGALQDAIDRGSFVAGFLGYEAGIPLQPRFPIDRKRLPNSVMPVLWFGVFTHCTHLSPSARERFLLRDGARVAQTNIRILGPQISNVKYAMAVDTIDSYLKAGDIYQVNHTFPISIQIAGDVRAFYRDTMSRAVAPYGGLIVTGEHAICSFSPELFVEQAGHVFQSRPMKGTAPRPLDPSMAADTAKALQRDEKSLAENLMIVDLIRNDFSRIPAIESVEVRAPFAVGKYPTLMQMTSDVVATQSSKIPEKTAFEDTMRALFPCGSITGAPKLRAMEIVSEIEPHPRGVYCGAIGFAAPARERIRQRFNVAIRTVVSDRNGNASLAVGSGIVADSTTASEYEECLLKARFLEERWPPFALIETMRWRADTQKVSREALHYARLEESAAFFGFQIDVDEIKDRMRVAAELLSGTQTDQRVRLLLSRTGAVSVTMSEAPAPWCDDDIPAHIRFADRPVDPDDPFLFHKTTNRAVYENALAKARKENPDCDEVILFNREGNVTEGSYTTVFAKICGTLVTPPIQQGLLSGVLRAEMLEKGLAHVARVSRADLLNAEEIWIGNSLRGLKPATLSKHTTSQIV